MGCMMRMLLLVGLLGCGASPTPIAAPSPHPELGPDPSFLDQYAATYRFRAGLPASITVTPNGDAVLFLQSGPRSLERDLYVFDPRTGATRVLLTAANLLGGTDEALSPEEKARRERMRLAARGIARFALSDDGTHLLIPLGGRQWVYERATGRITAVGPEGAEDAALSPDGQRLAVVKAGAITLWEVATGAHRAVEPPALAGATSAQPYGPCGTAEFVAQEEMGRFSGLWWGPDGTGLIFQCTDTTAVEHFSIGDPLDPARTPDTWPYPRPGKANAVVRLFWDDGQKTQEIQWDHATRPYLTRVVWAPNAPPVVLVEDRRQRALDVLTVTPTGATRLLLTEHDTTWVNLDQQMPLWLPDGSAFLWTSEREGAWCLEVRAADGTLRRRLTAPELGYRGLVQLTPDAVFVAGGADATQQHLFRVPLDGTSEAEALTSAVGLHGFSAARDAPLAVHTEQLETGPPRWWVRMLPARGPLPAPVGELVARAERPGFAAAPLWEEVEGTEGRRHAAVVVRPRGFDPALRYPVLLQVYGGPGAQMVRRAAEGLVFDQWLADHGFIVVRADGRGTPARGRAWARAILGDFIGPALADQVTILQAIGRKYPEMDMNRVGIQGWSFGGYFSAMAVMLRPDVFHAAVAGAPVADWRDYDTFYTERFLGLPEEEAAAYDQSSVLTHAAQLTRPLLIVHGTSDDNVYFMHALKLSDALFRAGRPHAFLPLSGFTHMVVDAAVNRSLQGRIIDHFRQALGGPVPRDAPVVTPVVLP